MKKEIGIIGMGKMGLSIALNLKEKGWNVYAYNRSKDKLIVAKENGINTCETIEELVLALTGPRVILTMVSQGDATNSIILNSLLNLVKPNDYIIDGGNSNYKNSINIYSQLNQRNINFVDMGISGGPNGARNGACLMIGGYKENFLYLNELFIDMSKNNSYEFFNGKGAGHFVKMIHNAIEYGVMQSIAEGFSLLSTSEYKFDLKSVAKIYNNGSIIESKLITSLIDAFNKYGNDLTGVSSTVEFNGEAHWALEFANENNIETPSLATAVDFRENSKNKPSFTGSILSALRNIFGGHKI